jgi:ParB/Sulfiredoxin domain
VVKTRGVPSGTPEPHPYALLLPALTDEEYRALKADIKANGILYPVITDEDGKVLDGVHRVRIAGELGIDPPVAPHQGLDEERKLHLAVGLNMRRRHLDADRRRDLVRKLHKDEGLSVRKIAAVAGWSKSTIDRDLRESPFEEALAKVARGRELIAEIPDEAGREICTSLNAAFGALYGLADGDWKAGRKRSDVVLTRMTLGVYDLFNITECLQAQARGEPLPTSKVRKDGRWLVKGKEWETLAEFWETLGDEERERWAEGARKLGALDRWERPVPDGTPGRDA